MGRIAGTLECQSAAEPIEFLKKVDWKVQRLRGEEGYQ